MLTIAVDAMGGDHCPKAEVSGAILATKSSNVRVILVGREDVVRAELDQNIQAGIDSRIVIHHASEQITMEDSAAKAVRTKKDSLHSCGLAAGSRWARAWLRFGRQYRRSDGHGQNGAGRGAGRRSARSGDRSSLRSTGTPVVVVDVGANVDCEPKMLAQFAVMGDIYSRMIFETRESPRGPALHRRGRTQRQRTHARRHSAAESASVLNFIGNVEGRDLYTGHADVVVCDGFIGNVALKVSEGIVDVIKHMLQGIAAGDGHPPDRLSAVAIGLHRVQEARRLFRIRRRAAAGSERRLHHLSWPLECERDQECDSCRRRVRRAATSIRKSKRVSTGTPRLGQTESSMKRLLAATLFTAALLSAQARTLSSGRYR